MGGVIKRHQGQKPAIFRGWWLDFFVHWQNDLDSFLNGSGTRYQETAESVHTIVHCLSSEEEK